MTRAQDKESTVKKMAIELPITAAGALVGYAIGGPVGVMVGSISAPTLNLVQAIISDHNQRLKLRLSRLVEKAFQRSVKTEEQILTEIANSPEWADSVIQMIRDLVANDPELDELFSAIIANAFDAEEVERNRIMALYSSIRGLNKVQIGILLKMYDAGGMLSAQSIAQQVLIPEIELRNAVRDLELRGMIEDRNTDPTHWSLRELGNGVAKVISQHASTAKGVGNEYLSK